MNSPAEAPSYRVMQTSLGEILLAADSSALIGLYFTDCKHVPAVRGDWKCEPAHPVLQQAAAELEEYLQGTRTSFSIPFRFAGTAFQQRIWREIAQIPFGETVTYTDLAERAGSPLAVRAVGTATGQNPISIVVPCHRVMGKNGSLTGFAGGLQRKQRLLELETDSSAKSLPDLQLACA